MSKLKKDNVQRTLCIPLWSRALAVKKLPHIMPNHDAVKSLVAGMAARFPGGLFVFDFVSQKGLRGGNAQVRMTNNRTAMTFSMENAETEVPAMSENIARGLQKSYLEGYPVSGIRYSWLTRQYIRSKRDQFFVVHAEFAQGEERR